jgi:DNA-binding LacI/PurR family transcriptional regulator
MDNRAHAIVATQHLIALGHRRIGCVFGQRESLTFRERGQGYLDALTAAGIPHDDTLIRFGASEFAHDGYLETLALLDSGAAPTALLIGADQLGQGVYAALLERGIRIPDEMALVAFDEAERAQAFQPPTTALATSDYGLGQESAKLLMSLLRGTATLRSAVFVPCRISSSR